MPIRDGRDATGTRPGPDWWLSDSHFFCADAHVPAPKKVGAEARRIEGQPWDRSRVFVVYRVSFWICAGSALVGSPASAVPTVVHRTPRHHRTSPALHRDHFPTPRSDRSGSTSGPVPRLGEAVPKVDGLPGDLGSRGQSGARGPVLRAAEPVSFGSDELPGLSHVIATGPRDPPPFRCPESSSSSC